MTMPILIEGGDTHTRAHLILDKVIKHFRPGNLSDWTLKSSLVIAATSRWHCVDFPTLSQPSKTMKAPLSILREKRKHGRDNNYEVLWDVDDTPKHGVRVVEVLCCCVAYQRARNLPSLKIHMDNKWRLLCKKIRTPDVPSYRELTNNTNWNSLPPIPHITCAPLANRSTKFQIFEFCSGVGVLDQWPSGMQQYFLKHLFHTEMHMSGTCIGSG